MSLTLAAKEILLSAVSDTSGLQISIHSDDPGVTGANEIVPAGRTTIGPYEAFENEAIWALNDVPFTVPASTPVTHVGAWTGAGVWMGSHELVAPELAQGSPHTFTVTEVVLHFDQIPAVTPTPTFSPIDPGDLLVDITAANTLSWGRDRAEGQWILSGNRFNAGLNDDNLAGGVAGRGLSFDAAGTTVESFLMQDGTTERIKPDTYNGIPVIHAKFQYVEDGSYSPANNTPVYNTGLNVPPSDQLFFDGSRFQLSHLEQSSRIKGGYAGSGVTRPADVVRYVTAFVVEPWMAANDYTTGFELHEGTETISSPIATQFRNGQLLVFSRDSDTLLPFNPTNPPTFTQIGAITLPSVGEWCIPILDFRLDPLTAGTGTGYFNMHLVDGVTGIVSENVSTFGNDWGYIFDPNDATNNQLNDQFYFSHLKVYNFHEFTPGPLNNWDPVGGNVRGLRTAFGALALGSTLTLSDFVGHARYHMGI